MIAVTPSNSRGECRRLIALPFVADMTRAYHDLLFWVEQFFRTGEAPVAIEDTLEIMALLDTTERAARRGKAEAV